MLFNDLGETHFAPRVVETAHSCSPTEDAVAEPFEAPTLRFDELLGGGDGGVPCVEHRHNAIALNSTVVNASRIVGPALAGLTIAWVGESGCFMINAVSYVAVLFALKAMRGVRQPPPAKSPGGPWKEIGDGMAYAFGNEPIRLVLLSLAVVSIAALPVYTLMPVFASK